MNNKANYNLDEDINQELSANGKLSGVESEPEEEIQDPFDPDMISIDAKVVPMETLLRRLTQSTIRLAPAFQRKEVWDLERKSRLIESLMLAIPLPMFYVAADEKANWDVVDGLQRLTTIKEFVLGNQYMQTRQEELKGNGFRLQRLEFWGDKYNGLIFNKLNEGVRNRILETEFRFTIINPGTPEEVKRNIFKRINTGGMPLTLQEIRHALYQGKSTTLLEELANSHEFKSATDHSVDDSRMAARELVLRFLAFSVRSYETYPRTSDMDNFLCDTMRLINIMPNMGKNDLAKIFKNRDIPNCRFTQIEDLTTRFNNGMKRSAALFRTHAFRKSYGHYRRSPINKTLFEVFGNLLADLSTDEYHKLMQNRDSFLTQYNSLLGNDSFVNILSRDSWKYAGVQFRYSQLKNLISNYTY